VVSRWLKPSPDPKEEAQIEAALVQWRRHRAMALALSKEDWAQRDAKINANLATRRAEHAGAPPRQLSSPLRVTLALVLLVVTVSALAATGQIDVVRIMHQLTRTIPR
jgi:hypothetical protein